MQAAPLPPELGKRCCDDERHAEPDRDVGEIERDAAVVERVRDAAALGDAAYSSCERATGGDARSERERQRTRPRRKPHERERDRRTERVHERRALV